MAFIFGNEAAQCPDIPPMEWTFASCRGTDMGVWSFDTTVALNPDLGGHGFARHSVGTSGERFLCHMKRHPFIRS